MSDKLKLKIIKLCDDQATREKGLMDFRKLKNDECAFFEFPVCGKHSFWNKNVSFPLSLVFCDKNGVVEDIKYLEAEQAKSVSPDSYDIKYVVETHIDAPKEQKIRKGSKMIVGQNEVVFK